MGALQQWETTDFLTWQAKIVNEYKRPDQFVTHDFAAPPRPEVNEVEVSKSLDIAAANPYHGTQDNFDGEWSSMVGDYTRSLKHTNYLITETNGDTIGWDSKNQFPPTTGRCVWMCIRTFLRAQTWWSIGIGTR